MGSIMILFLSIIMREYGLVSFLSMTHWMPLKWYGSIFPMLFFGLLW